MNQQPTNTIGLFGFIVALTGLLCCVTFPIGLILSLIGLRKPPRGFAIAGTVIGSLGTVVVLGLVALISWGVIEQEKRLNQAHQIIDNYKVENGELPDYTTGNDLIKGIKGSADRDLRYERGENGTEYLLRDAGEDRVFNTDDDKTSSRNAE